MQAYTMTYTKSNSTKKIAWGMAIMLAFLAISTAPAYAQVYYYHVPPYGDYGGYRSTSNRWYPTYPTYPVYNSYPTYPTFTAYPTYPTYPNYYNPLTVSCYASLSTVAPGSPVTWSAFASGGNGNYSYYWTGDESLSSYGQSTSKTYYYAGYKNAQVTVTSGNGQSATANCGTVNVFGSYYGQGYPSFYSPLSVSCSANQSYVPTGGAVSWNAYATGGSGIYTYTWTGSDNLYGSGQNLYYNYITPGIKSASVTVYSNGQSITQACSTTVNVGGSYGGYAYPVSTPVYQAPVYATGNYNGLDIGCYVDPTNARVNQPVTWKAEVTGGAGPYTYSWTGSDGLTGSQSSIIKYYSKSGAKSAIVTVASADGKTGTHACSNQLTVSGSGAPAPAVKASVTKPAAAAPAAPAEVEAPVRQDNTSLASSSYFSLKNVPWGWVGVLVILVLFATVMYLLFNRQKI